MAEVQLAIGTTAANQGLEALESKVKALDDSVVNLQKKLDNIRIKTPSKKDMAKMFGDVEAVVRVVWSDSDARACVEQLRTYFASPRNHITAHVQLAVDKSALRQVKAVTENASRSDQAKAKARAAAAKSEARTQATQIVAGTATPGPYITAMENNPVTGKPYTESERRKAVGGVLYESTQMGPGRIIHSPIGGLERPNINWETQEKFKELSTTSRDLAREAREAAQESMRYKKHLGGTTIMGDDIMTGGTKYLTPEARRFAEANAQLAQQRMAANRLMSMVGDVGLGQRTMGAVAAGPGPASYLRLEELRALQIQNSTVARQREIEAFGRQQDYETSLARALDYSRSRPGSAQLGQQMAMGMQMGGARPGGAGPLAYHPGVYQPTPEAIFERYRQQLEMVKLGQIPGALRWSPEQALARKGIETIKPSDLIQMNDPVHIDELIQAPRKKTADWGPMHDNIEVLKAKRQAGEISKDVYTTAMKARREDEALRKQAKTEQGGMMMYPGEGNAARQLETLEAAAKAEGRVVDYKNEAANLTDEQLTKNKDLLDQATKNRTLMEQHNKMLETRVNRMYDLEQNARRMGRLNEADKLRTKRLEAMEMARDMGFETADQTRKGGGRRFGFGAGEFDPNSPKAKKQLDDYGKQIDKITKQTARLERAEQKAFKRRSGAMGGWFAKFSIYMSGIAATLFVWQELNQAISAALATGKSFTDTLNRVSDLAGYTDNETRRFNETMTGLTRSIGAMPKEAAEAQKALMDIGASPQEQIQLLDKTITIARSGLVDMAQAASMAKYDSYGTAESFYELGKAAEKGINGPMARAKGEIALVMDEFYRKGEPTLILFLNDFAKWAREESDGIIEALSAITTSTLALLELMAAGVTGILDFTAALAGLAKYEGLMSGGMKMPSERTVRGRENIYAGIMTDPQANLNELVGERDRLQQELAATKKLLDDKGYRTLDEITPFEQMTGLKPIFNSDDQKKKIERIERDLRVLEQQLDKTDYYDRISRFDPSFDSKSQRPMRATNEEISAAWQEVYAKLGHMDQSYFEAQRDEIDKNAAKIEYAIGGSWAEQIRSVDEYNLRMKAAAPDRKALKEVFNMRGFLDPEQEIKYLKIVGDQIEFQTKQLQKQLNLTTEQTDALIEKRKAMAKASLDKPTVKMHEGLFEATGSMSDFLYSKREKALDTKLSDDLAKAGGDMQARKMAYTKYQLALLALEKETFQTRYDQQRNFFDQTGIATEEFIANQIRLYEIQYQENLKKGVKPEDAKRTFQAQLNAFESEYLDPMLSLQESLTQSSVGMTEKEYELKMKKVDLWVAYVKLRNEDVAAIEAEAARRRLEIEAQKLEGSKIYSDGIKLGLIEMELEAESTAQVVAKNFKAAARGVDDAFKNSFFDVMEGRFDNFKDHAIGALEAIRDAANEILYDMLKKSLDPKGTGSTGFLGALIGGIGSIFGGSSGGSSLVSAGGSYAGAGTYGVNPRHTHDTGGWINEPVVGIGTRTGDIHTFAERNAEYVVNPMRSGGGGSLSIHVPVNVTGEDGQRVAARLQTRIEDTVRTVIREEMS